MPKASINNVTTPELEALRAKLENCKEERKKEISDTHVTIKEKYDNLEKEIRAEIKTEFKNYLNKKAEAEIMARKVESARAKLAEIKAKGFDINEIIEGI